MEDSSHLDKKYFVDRYTYNCPFCNRRNLSYAVTKSFTFDWTKDKKCLAFFVQCSSCKNTSMHLTYNYDLVQPAPPPGYRFYLDSDDIDSEIFYSVPTSFFVLDSRIPNVVRQLITEAEGCLKMNFLTGASACMRKAIYELLILEKAKGKHYEDRIKSLKKKNPDSDPMLFGILGNIQDMTSDKVHEQSWDKWDSNNLKLIIETLKTVLYDIYVVPQIKTERSKNIAQLLTEAKTAKKTKDK